MTSYVYISQLDAFTLYHQVQEEQTSHASQIGPALPALGHATSGAVGTAISKLVLYPLDLIITRLQVQSQFKGASEPATDDDYNDIVDAAQKIYKNEGGIKAFYCGVVSDTTKSMVDSFLFFLAYNFMRSSRQENPRKALPVAEELGIGMLAGALSKLCTTPVQNVVTRKQTAAMRARRSPLGTSSLDLSVKDIALQIRDEKGLAGFWSGYSASLVLTVNPALTFLLHETLLRLLVKREDRSNPGSRTTFLLAALSKVVASTITYPFSLAKTRAQVGSSGPTDEDRPESLQEKSDDDPAVKRRKKAGRATIFSSILQIAREEGLKGLYQGLSGEVLKGFFSHGLTMLLKERVHSLIIQVYYLVLKALKKYPSPAELAEAGRARAQAAVDAAKESVENGWEDGMDLLEGVAEGGKEVIIDATETGKGAVSSTMEMGREAVNGASKGLRDAVEMGRGQVFPVCVNRICWQSMGVWDIDGPDRA
ncbi:mitochondrial carrier [Saccharata proteae CBS 121410]|uniref:Mitochondrial carrier n=1 Tax=Saccharata proteae CBS 121410 TaxID=1314787 RepID=A0A9P4HRE6_9PEZI|nr:mitochondrial carrier [Saccharata proteae CBS 121410]